MNFHVELPSGDRVNIALNRKDTFEDVIRKVNEKYYE